MIHPTVTLLAKFTEPAAHAVVSSGGDRCLVVSAHNLTAFNSTELEWSTQINEHLSRVIMISGGRIGSLEGRTFVLRAADTGTIVAEFELEGAPADLVATPDGDVVVALHVSGATKLVRLAADDHTVTSLECAADLPTSESPPVLGVSDGEVIVAVAGMLHGLAPDGSWRWHADRHGFAASPRDTDALLTTPPLDLGTKTGLVAGFGWPTGHGFFCIDAVARRVQGIAPAELVLHVSEAAAIAHTDSGALLVATGVDRTLAGVELDGRVRWRRDARSPVVSVVPGGPGTVFAIHSVRPSVWALYRNVYEEPVCFAVCLDATSGVARWTWLAPGPITAAARCGDRLFAVSENQLFALALEESASP